MTYTGSKSAIKYIDKPTVKDKWMRPQLRLPGLPTVRPRVIRGVTVPNRAAECAVYLRTSVLRDNRLPSVPEVSDALGVSQPAVVQLENTLRERGVLRGLHRGGGVELANEILIPDSAVVAMVASTLCPSYVDRQLGATVYTDADAGPWDEKTYTKVVRDRAGIFGFDFENLHDVPELVRAGYLQGKPGCFRLNKQLWDRDKVIFIKTFQDLKPGKVGAGGEKDSKALFEALVKAVGGRIGATLKQSGDTIFICPDPKSRGAVPATVVCDLQGSECQEINGMARKWIGEFMRVLQKAEEEYQSLAGDTDNSKRSAGEEWSEFVKHEIACYLYLYDKPVTITRFIFTGAGTSILYLMRPTENRKWSFEPADWNEMDCCMKRLENVLQTKDFAIFGGTDRKN